VDVAEWLMFGALTGLSAYDLKTRQIPVPVVVFLGIAALIYRLSTGGGIPESVLGLLPGIGLLLVSVCTRESIGTGDGMVLCAVGLFCGLRQTMAVLGMALIISAVLAMVLLVLRRAGRKTELPFLPSLLAGYLLNLLW